MPIDIVEMLWQCLYCATTNKGRNKVCDGCGKPKSKDCNEWLPTDVSHSSASVVSDETLLHHFHAGPDWKCKYCDSLEWKVDGSCAQCGAAQDEKEQFEEITAAAKAPDIKKQKQEPRLPVKKIVEVPDSVPMDFPEGKHSPKKFLFAFVIVPFLIVALYFIFRVVKHEATVTSTFWSETTHVYKNQVMHHDGWYAPGDAFNVHALGQRINHYDHVIDHYDTVPYTYNEACGQSCVSIPRSCYTTSRSCTSNKNGSATCSGGDRVCTGGGQNCSTKYCSRTGMRKEPVYRNDPVYQMYYEWDVHEWVFNRDVVERGTDTAPYQASPERVKLASDERDEIETVMTVVFTDTDDHEKHDYTPANIIEFQSLSVGKYKTITVNSIGGVKIVKGE